MRPGTMLKPFWGCKARASVRQQLDLAALRGTQEIAVADILVFAAPLHEMMRSPRWRDWLGGL
jgi:hypothetical protein